MSLHYTLGELQKMREAAGIGMLSLGLYGTGDLVSSTPIPDSRMMGGAADPGYGGYLLGEGMTPAAARYLGALHNHFPAIAEAAAANSERIEVDPELQIVSAVPPCFGLAGAEFNFGEYVENNLKRWGIEGWRRAEAAEAKLADQEEIRAHAYRCGFQDGQAGKVTPPIDPEGDTTYLDAIRRTAERHGWSILKGSLGAWIDRNLPKVSGSSKIFTDWKCPGCGEVYQEWVKFCPPCDTHRPTEVPNAR